MAKFSQLKPKLKLKQISIRWKVISCLCFLSLVCQLFVQLLTRSGSTNRLGEIRRNMIDRQWQEGRQGELHDAHTPHAVEAVRPVDDNAPVSNAAQRSVDCEKRSGAGRVHCHT